MSYCDCETSENILLCFDPDKILLDRVKCHKIMEAVGTLPSNPQQNKILGIPFVGIDAQEGLRHRVKLDLEDRGFTVLDGLKYGSDFAVYNGDPLVVHGFFLVKIVVKSLSTTEFILWNRLAASVMKNILLAYYDERKNAVSYTLVERSLSSLVEPR